MWTTPSAKRVLGANAPGDLVAAQLHRRLTSYDAAAVAGTSPYQGTLGLYEAKTAAAPAAPSPAQTATADATPRLVAHFERAHPGIATRRVGVLVSRRLPWLAARPTALTSDGGLLVVTTTREDLADEWLIGRGAAHRRMPARITSRVLHDLHVTGVTHAWVLCEIQGHDSSDVLVRRVVADRPAVREEMQTLFETEQRFWVRHVAAGEPPEPTRGDHDLLVRRLRAAGPHSMVATPEMIRDLALRRRLKTQVGELQDDLRAVEALLMHRMGDARLLIAHGQTTDAPVVLARFGNTRQFAEARFRQEHPALARRFTRRRRTAVLDVEALAAAEPALAAGFFARPFIAARSAMAAALLDTHAYPSPPEPRDGEHDHLPAGDTTVLFSAP